MKPGISLERGQSEMIVYELPKYNQSCQNALDADSGKSVLWLCAGNNCDSDPREHAEKKKLNT